MANKWFSVSVLLLLSTSLGLKAQTINAASCNTSDVQTAINAAKAGQTVAIPAGTCNWSSGVTVSGKAVNIQGKGSGRIVAYDNGTEMLTVGTGTKTIAIAGFSPGMTSSVFANGQTMTLFATGFESSYSMTGTVTSYSGGTLTMNITSTKGSGSTHRWLVATQPTTVLINNSSSPMFAITEDTSSNTKLSDIKIDVGSGSGDGVDFNYASNGRAIVLQNCWIRQGTGDSVRLTTNRGVISNCSFDSPTFSMAPIALHVKNTPPSSWTTASNWGMKDTTGENNIYVETSDFEAYLNLYDNDDNGRSVFRHNLMNNAGFGTHGADTSTYGQRYFEAYNNTGVFNAYSDGSTFNMNWWFFVRGGSYVIHDNTLAELSSQDYGTKQDVLMIVMNLQRNAGPNPCWGSNPSSGGQYYHAPRQVGYGYVDGSGKSNYPVDGVNNSSSDSVTYVGDSEPAYIWNNSREPLTNVATEDYGAGNTNSCTGSTDTSAKYIVANRDYFNGSTAKPGYTPYTYPHPLATGTATAPATLPSPPTSVKAVVN